MSLRFLKIFIFILLSASFFIACKKDALLLPQNLKGNTDTANYIYGWLRKYIEYNYTYGQKAHDINNAFGCAYFSSSPVSIHGTAVYNYVNAGKIIMDIDSLSYGSPTQNYYKTIIAANLKPFVHWDIDGNTQTGIQPFVYDCALPFPVYTDYTSIPKVISKSEGITFEFAGSLNTTRISVYIYSGATWAHKEIFLGQNIAFIGFNKNELNGLIKTANGYIDIYLYNEEIRIINNRNIRFSHVVREIISKIQIAD